jgi:beta-glucanase (GH16 family)
MSVALVGLVGALAVVVGATSGAASGRGGKADLSVRSLSSPPGSVERGRSFTAVLRVTNLGTRTARRSTVRGFLSRDSRKSSRDVALQPARSVPPLKPGKAIRRKVTVRVPRATPTGLWFLIACVDAARTVRERNERNNCRTSARRTAVTAEGSPPSPPPPPIAGQGYTKRFEDNFDGVALDAAKWSNHSFWRTAEAAPSGVRVSNGTVKITNAANTRGADCAQSRPCSVDIASGPEWGGSPSKYDFTYGYVEARMKFTGGRGSWPAFWLAPVSQADWANWPNCPKRNEAGQLLPQANYELDIMEHQGDEPKTFYGTQHSNTNGTCGVPDNNSQSVTVNTGASLADEFHVIAAKWTPTEMRWYVDGAQVGVTRSTRPESKQRMYIILSMYVCGWDSTNSCTTATPNNLITEVDWVRVWRQ